jgi:cell division control protein 6
MKGPPLSLTLPKEQRTELIRDLLVLTDSYRPPVLLFRGRAYETIKNELSIRATRNFPASGPHIRLAGYPGTGKTETIKKVRDDLAALALTNRVKLKTAYVNCRHFSTKYTIYRAILKEYGVQVKDGWQQYRLDSALENVQGNQLVILDEVDAYLRRGDFDVLHALSRRPGLSLVLVSNRFDLNSMIADPGILSSLGTREVNFDPYTADEIAEILKERAKKAFYVMPNPSVIMACAAVAAKRNGDARYGINLLAKAAQMAITGKSHVITDSLVISADRAIEGREIVDTLMSYPPSIRYLFKAIVTVYPETDWRVVYGAYKKNADNYEPLSYHRARDALWALEKAGIARVMAKPKKGTTVSLEMDDDMARRVVAQLDATDSL